MKADSRNHSAHQRFLLLLLGVAPLAFAAEQKPDFSGVWEMEGWSAQHWDVTPPYTAAGKAAQLAWEADSSNDPTYSCIGNLVRITSAPLPHEIIQHDNRVTLLYEYHHQVRRGFMDGRVHPENSYPTLMGHSIASWDGDTLVIDARDIQAGYLRPQGMPHTDKLRVIERRTLLEGGELKSLETTIIDPVYYREPWSVTTQWRRTNADILDYECIVRSHLPAPE